MSGPVLCCSVRGVAGFALVVRSFILEVAASRESLIAVILLGPPASKGDGLGLEDKNDRQLRRKASSVFSHYECARSNCLGLGEEKKFFWTLMCQLIESSPRLIRRKPGGIQERL